MRVQYQQLLAMILGLAAAGANVARGAPSDTLSTDDSRGSTVTPADNGGLDEVVVTARRRQESLQDVPIAVSALSAEMLLENQINTVKDIAAYSPGLNINSDSVGRSFVSIRGIGTTLINTVQPGRGHIHRWYLRA